MEQKESLTNAKFPRKYLIVVCVSLTFLLIFYAAGGQESRTVTSPMRSSLPSGGNWSINANDPHMEYFAKGCIRPTLGNVLTNIANLNGFTVDFRWMQGDNTQRSNIFALKCDLVNLFVCINAENQLILTVSDGKGESECVVSTLKVGEIARITVSYTNKQIKISVDGTPQACDVDATGPSELENSIIYSSDPDSTPAKGDLCGFSVYNSLSLTTQEIDAGICDEQSAHYDPDAPKKAGEAFEGPLNEQTYKAWMDESSVALVLRYLDNTNVYLEWGSGGSTVDFAPKTKIAYSIEHNEGWCATMRHSKQARPVFVEFGGNVHYNCVPVKHGHLGWKGGFNEGSFEQFKSYVTEIDNLGVAHFDRVLIDGRARLSCALKLIMGRYVNESSYMFIHDFQRNYYHPLLRYYKEIEKAHTLSVLRPKVDAQKILYQDISDCTSNPGGGCSVLSACQYE